MQLPRNSLGDFCLYPTKDDLPLGLQKYVIFDEACGMSFFKHPLIVTMMPVMTPLPIEEYLEEKSKWALQALDLDRSAQVFLGRHERAFRSKLFLDLLEDGYWEDAKTDAKRACEFWKTAAYVWADCEEDESSDIWEEILEADVPCREFMTSSRDRKALKAMGGQITVYRGVHAQDREQALEDGILGFQWTLDRKTALFFAKRFLKAPDRGYILKATVRTSDVIAYLTGRGESEIIISPDVLSFDGVEVSAAARVLDGDPRKRAKFDRVCQSLNVIA